MTRRPALAVMLALAVSGCVTFRTVDDGIARARIGETVVRSGVSIMPLAVVEDSRCPAAVTCIRAGTVRIAAEVSGTRTELTLGQPVAAAGASVSLVEVYPARRADTTYYPDEYRLGFRVSR
jgi:hypothetical protein